MSSLAVLGLGGWLCVALLLIRRHRERERLLNACHEVRGPLTALHLAVHACARRGELSPRRAASVELELRRAGLALDDLAGRQARSGEVDVAELLTLQVQTWADVAAAHGASLDARVECTGSVVKADGLRLAQAVGNVLANAIEHGGGRVRLRVRRIEDRIVVEVSDDGPGLPATVASLARGARRRGARGRGLRIAGRALASDGGRLRSLPSARGARLALELPVRGAASPQVADLA
ncbi:MAG TPA: ATP-binding protein [Baekduia sp.]|nr:ATP-binding protein [Baekduia sp.]